jgi:hypothetical protein
MRFCFVAAAFILCDVGYASAQACPPPPTGGTVYFQFQVETPARFVGDPAVLPAPNADDRRRSPFPPDFALVQFIVDTAGVPQAKSLRMLVTPDSLSLETVKAALERWRFSPARNAGCIVPQLVQTPLRWR